ncbi:MAG: prepilin-type N-terminal cleavage/methylation domain-containing protein [Caulobacteraceae bacterium]|nr:prepilin-type N-terminal cleavage/methylation domain-containing protein [Caulobacteraceae bacterium]
MSEAGYTLVEMLAALIIIGLAVGGLTEAAHVVGRAQAAAMRTAAQARALRAADQALARLVLRQGPFASDAPNAFEGGAQSLAFPCRDGSTCRADLQPNARAATRLAIATGTVEPPLSLGQGQAAFVYGGDSDVNGNWPPSGPRQILHWIGVQDVSSGAPLALADVWREEPPGCVFDPIAQACRAAP